MRKFLIISLIVIVLAIAIIVGISASKKPTAQEETEKIVPVETFPVTLGNVQSTCEIIGTIRANKTAYVFPEIMGRITRVLVKEGTYVNKDSKLMALRNETLGFEYEEGYITAPISGNVANITVNNGSMVTPQSPVAMVVEFSRVEVVFNVSENAMNCISKGGKVRVMADAAPETQFNGTISEVSPVIDPLTRTVAAKAVVNNSKKILKPGMTARITLNLGSRENVLIIPRDALLNGYLFVVRDSTSERRDVTVGLIGDKFVEILAGIKEGEQVVVVGQQRLAGGEKINPIPRSE
ncbi:MAG: efflux RND transporter periplasmic adaptor subunit [bacterium]